MPQGRSDFKACGVDRLPEVRSAFGMTDLYEPRSRIFCLRDRYLSGPRPGILPMGVLNTKQDLGVMPESLRYGGGRGEGGNYERLNSR